VAQRKECIDEDWNSKPVAIFQVFVVRTMKVSFFWDVTSCSLLYYCTEMSEKPAASVIRANTCWWKQTFRLVRIYCSATCHIPEDTKIKSHYFYRFRARISGALYTEWISQYQTWIFVFYSSPTFSLWSVVFLLPYIYIYEYSTVSVEL
jgi:hypothetical protein